MSELPNAILPGDIIAYILLRLPVKPICRLKCVSKPWRSFLSNPKFAKDHAKHHNNNPEGLILTEAEKDCAVYMLTLSAGKSVARKVQFLPSELEGKSVVAGSCHGLVLLVLDSAPYAQPMKFLFNPITLETAKVTPLETLYSTACCYGFGYDSSSDDYKIVCLSQVYGRNGSVVNVYSVGMKCWKRIVDSPYNVARSPFHEARAPGVYLNGCIHWLGRDTINHLPVLLCYDLARDEFEEGLFPFDVHGIFEFDIIVLEGCLALACEKNWCEMTTDVWVMREYGVRDSWVKFTTIDCSEYCVNTNKMPYPAVCALNEDEIVLKRDGKMLVAYNWRNKNCRDLVIDGIPDNFRSRRVMPFRGSLVSPN